MRLVLLLGTAFCLYAAASTPPKKDFFEKSLQKVGQKLDKAAVVVQDKVHTAVEKAKDPEEQKTVTGRVKSAMSEFGDGVKRAWHKLTGDKE